MMLLPESPIFIIEMAGGEEDEERGGGGGA